jgi:hypothetical protein
VDRLRPDAPPFAGRRINSTSGIMARDRKAVRDAVQLLADAASRVLAKDKQVK